LAEHDDSPESVPDASGAGMIPSSRPRTSFRRRRANRKDAVVATTAAPAPAAVRRRRSPGRTILTIATVTGLVAAAGLPAYAALKPEEQTVTLQQLAKDGAQTLVIASDVETGEFARDSYAATTPDEIAAKKAEEAAKAAAEARARAARTTGYSSALPAGVPLVAPGSGIVRRPLPYFNNFGTPYAGHRGTDYMVERGTPIYSVADGVVVASTDGGGALGVTITIAHNINGTSVESTYAHMLPGSRTVGVGATVSVGQMIGQVSDTGLAFGTHLHLMIKVNGSVVSAEGWLAANAG